MQQAALQEDDLYYTDASAGDILRHTREHYGQSLFDIEKALRIRASQIEALEQNNYNQLPGRTYVIGFVRSYAEYLGLDPDYMVNLYKGEMAGQSPKPELHFPAAASDSQLPAKHIVFISTVFIILALTGSMMLYKKNTPKPMDTIPAAPQIAAPQTVEETPATETADVSPPEVTETTENAAAPEISSPPPVIEQPPAITLTLLQNSWVELRDATGKSLVSRILKKGEVYNLKNRDDLFISIGNAGGVSLSLGDQILGPMGQKGEVIRNFPVTHEAIQEKYGLPAPDAVNQAQ